VTVDPNDGEPLFDLLQAVRGCRICAAKLPLGPRPIVQIDRGARLLIASQAPGRKAHLSGVPFEDASGDTLRAWLGIDRATFYESGKVAILPRGFCYPGRGRSGDLPPSPECAPLWHARLLRQMPNLALTLVIGRHAQLHHLALDRKSTLTATVRAFREHLPTCFPLPHPSPLNGPWLKRNPWFETEVLPVLRSTVAAILAADRRAPGRSARSNPPPPTSKRPG
jgi:uracil-DNA glycosylase